MTLVCSQQALETKELAIEPKSKTPANENVKNLEKNEEVFSIFILKAQLTSLTQAETFLRNRNWIVASATNLREALAYIIQRQPQYVLISADHPNKKVRILPKMLVQAFPVRVIGFAEKGTGLSTKQLHEMNVEYNLYPPVSGPAIERIILKMRKDDELRAQQTHDKGNLGRSLDGISNANESITLKGDMNPESLKASFEQARMALTQLVSSESGNNEDSTFNSNDSNRPQSGMHFQPGTNSQNDMGPAYRGGPATDQGQGPSFVPGSEKGSDPQAKQNGGPLGSSFSGTQEGPQSGAFQTGSGKASNPSSHFNPQDGAPPSSQMNGWAQNPGGNPFHPQGSNSGSKDNSSSENGSFYDGESNWESEDPSARKGKETNTSSESNQSESEAGGSLVPLEELARRRSALQRKNKSAPILESEYVPKENKTYKIYPEGPVQGKDRSSIIVRGTHEAIEQTVNRKGPEKIEKVEKSSNLACITIESPRFSGYLVCALGSNRKVDDTLFTTIQKRLFQFLKANGESIKEADKMDLKIQEVDFSAWALEQAEFLKKSIHDGDEIAMAFFPNQQLEISLEDSTSQKMLQIRLEDLKDNAALEFDLYIFMPQNNKYLLYTPKGRPIYDQQKSRLTEKGITHMHLRRDSAHEVKKYKAQNFLNDKIAAYKALATSA